MTKQNKIRRRGEREAERVRVQEVAGASLRGADCTCIDAGLVFVTYTHSISLSNRGHRSACRVKWNQIEIIKGGQSLLRPR